MKIGVVQMNSGSDKAKNVADAERLVRCVAAQDKPDLVVLPEYFAFLGEGREAIQGSAETFPDGPVYQRLSALARQLGVTLHAGSMVEKSGDSFFNTSLVFDPQGREIAKYRKMHLFDIDAPGGLSYRESEIISRGRQVVTYRVGRASVGCAICYDLRFPELFRALRDQGADVIVLPAAFTLMTGKDHWEVLARARAIETQTCFVAVGQTGAHADGRKWCWDHEIRRLLLILAQKMEGTPISLLTAFEDLPDPRGRECPHRLDELLLAAICGVISGAESSTSVVQWSQMKLDWLRHYLPYAHGIASHDTFGRVFSLLDASQFEHCFMRCKPWTFEAAPSPSMPWDASTTSPSRLSDAVPITC
ncbi:nitrilase-related carbon-nitrogen hydrolase [Verminephrobacter eiseniae]|uniref:nitrilase-related carbon-nitrogen hydrolase n=1 Tax=Verminephrobacter eiseniae TaxID=364317 RepID=UPI0022370425|nr:nitrilase-related carbon-nitrogen hydrolase [Verminephrobacter eiseniae]